jgi:hypothetical protein
MILRLDAHHQAGAAMIAQDDHIARRALTGD